MPMQNPKQGNKWLCNKCRTWCMPEVPKCSWCGAAKPTQKKVAPKKNEEK